MQKDEIVMFDDATAAEYRTNISGWVSRHGRFFGTSNSAEDMARYDGCTHLKCSICNEPALKPYTLCQTCRKKKQEERYKKMQEEPWDGESPIYSIVDDVYFFGGEDELLSYCEDNQRSISDLMLVHCEPVTFHTIDVDYWDDELGEEGEFSQKVLDAIDQLNAALQDEPPQQWQMTSKRVRSDIDDLFNYKLSRTSD